MKNVGRKGGNLDALWTGPYSYVDVFKFHSHNCNYVYIFECL